MGATRVITRNLARRWKYRGIRARPARRGIRVHWRQLEQERWKAEALGVDRQGRLRCQACGGEYERAHECPFPF